MSELEQKIISRLEELRVHLQADGGDLEVVAIKDKVVELKLRGACGGCPHATAEAIADACAAHGTDADKLVEKLNAYFAEK